MKLYCYVPASSYWYKYPMWTLRREPFTLVRTLEIPNANSTFFAKIKKIILVKFWKLEKPFFVEFPRGYGMTMMPPLAASLLERKFHWRIRYIIFVAVNCCLLLLSFNVLLAVATALFCCVVVCFLFFFVSTITIAILYRVVIVIVCCFRFCFFDKDSPYLFLFYL